MLNIKPITSGRSLSLRKPLTVAATVLLFSVFQQAHAGVSGPLIGDPTLLGSTFFKLSDVGYKQSEYFISGSANSYTNTKPLTTDGKWSVKVADQAYFKTRVVVYQPTDPAKFNGTVLVEWFNISSGGDASSEWIMAHTELIRKGYAWIGVTAQKGAIDGGGINYVGLPLQLKLLNFPRYWTLWHPGDKYAYDIFSQAARAVLKLALFAPNPLKGLQVQRAIAAGESQSADFMMTYVNAIAPRDKLFDGYLIHSRLHGAAGLTPQTTGKIDFAPRPSVQVRNDLNVPVMMLQTETDLTVLGSYPDMQPDSANFRLWEVAGTAHADNYVSNVGLSDLGNDPNTAAVVESKSAVPILITCDKPINAGPHHWVVKAAIAALDNWLRNGVAPPYADRLQFNAATKTFLRDSVGNALGGIRTPYVDAPIATLTGDGQTTGNSFCNLYGTTKLFDNAQLASLYPNHAAYTWQVNNSVDNAVRAGFLLKPDGDLIKSSAQMSSIGNY